MAVYGQDIRWGTRLGKDLGMVDTLWSGLTDTHAGTKPYCAWGDTSSHAVSMVVINAVVEMHLPFHKRRPHGKLSCQQAIEACATMLVVRVRGTRCAVVNPLDRYVSCASAKHKMCSCQSA